MNKKLVVGLLALALTITGCSQVKDGAGSENTGAAETAESQEAATEASKETPEEVTTETIYL